ncbi:MAG TPA: ABC-type transport auxiliary lipoprotein family protein [Candidatus Acidoferrales bacterium]|nr:ABC-type transport auxiliary lipoprotein family protein [Candidatus Acidoferrales bacterium]
MNRIRVTTMFALFSLFILAGCSGKMRYPSYYTLNLPAPPDPPAAENAKATVAIHEFTAPAYLRRGEIVFKTSPEAVGFYTYHRWAVDPCEFMTDSMRDRLNATGLFAQVKRYDGRSDAEYLVSGRLEKLEEIDYDGGVKVVVTISAQMVRFDSGAAVWTKSVSETGNVNKRDVPAVVSAMSSAMDHAMQELLSSLPVEMSRSAMVKRN